MNKTILLTLIALIGLTSSIYAQEVTNNTMICEFRELDKETEGTETEAQTEDAEAEEKVSKNGFYIRVLSGDQEELGEDVPDSEKEFLGSEAMTQEQCEAVVNASTEELTCSVRSIEEDGTQNFFMYDSKKKRFFGNAGISHEQCVASLKSSTSQYTCAFTKIERPVAGEKDEEGKPVMDSSRSGFFVYNMEREVFVGSQGLDQQVCGEIIANSSERYTCGKKAAFRNLKEGFFAFDNQTLRYIGEAKESATSCLESINVL